MSYFDEDDDDGGMVYGQVDDTTLQQVEAIVNEDVEMLAPPADMFYLVLDTNILIHFLDTIQQFVADAEALNLPVIVLIPGVVVSELDWQKNARGEEKREQLAWAARRASTWLLEKVRGKDPKDARERRWVKGQTHDETTKDTGKWNIRVPGHMEGAPRDQVNDDLVLDCCDYYTKIMCDGSIRNVILCSHDTNMCLMGASRGYTFARPEGHWSSRNIADVIWGEDVLTQMGIWESFDQYSTKFVRQAGRNNIRVDLPLPAPAHDPDAMDIDETVQDVEPTSAYRSTDLLNALHVEVIDHFTERLQELVQRVGGTQIPVERVFTSMHAPSWQKTLLKFWTVGECINYLVKEKGLVRTPLVAKLYSFLLRPYQRGEQGARTGQDWPRAMWKDCEDGLESIGEKFEDEPMLTSVQRLRPYSEEIWGRRQRPAGM